ncbi:hypothetical protein ACIQWS_01255 [Phyllobacterium sp. NPDC097923]|uniref:hypothetical protein n=1 Tax=Phyllobacterium sp. NPDC097923 TaxID=3364404 RepID=UPI00383B7DD3
MDKLSISTMKLENWPIADRSLWLAALTPAGPFDSGGLAAAWRPATIRGTEKSYGVYLSWLQTHSLLEEMAMPADRVDRDNVQSFLDSYGPGRSDHTVATVIRGIAYMLRATVPPDGLPWLTKLAHRLANNAVPSRPKLPRMALPQELLALAERLMVAGVELVQKGRRSGAPLYRDGLMIAMLVARPLRLRNLSALCIGGSLVQNQGGYRIQFPKEQTKKEVAIDFLCPEWLNAPIDLYLRDVRPVLIGSDRVESDGAFWIGRRGRPLTESMITIRIGSLTKRHLGRRVSPHLFRDISATMVAVHDAAHVGITKSVLGHATLKSSQAYYNQAGTFAAAKTYGDLLDQLRNGSKG